MNTFITAKSLIRAAANLDPRRCFKQAVEIKQILRALEDPNYAWSRHPSVRQWRDFPFILETFGYHCAVSSTKEGYNHSLKFIDHGYKTFPWQFNQLITNHRGLLIRKEPDYYRPQWPDAIIAKYSLYIHPDTLIPFHPIYEPHPTRP